MVKLSREDTIAALLLSWLKYTPVIEHDVQHIKHPGEILEKELEAMAKSKLKISKSETPETQLSKKITKVSSVCSNFSKRELPKKQLRSKNPEIHEDSRNSNPIAKRVKFSPFALMSYSYESSRNCNPVPKRVKMSSSALLNHPKSSSGPSRNSNPVSKRTSLLNRRKSPSESSRNSNSSESSVDRPELPRFPSIENLRGLIGQCSKPFEKKLTKSDVDDHQGRLLLKNEEVKKQLLPLLNGDSENVADGIEIQTFDQLGGVYSMRFKTRGNYRSYVIVGSWRKFIRDHGLKNGDFVAVWMFRNNQTDELCFALRWRKQEEDDEDEQRQIKKY